MYVVQEKKYIALHKYAMSYVLKYAKNMDLTKRWQYRLVIN